MNKALFFVCISLFLGNAYLWAQQDCEPTESVEAIVKFNTTPYPPEGALSGVFSVSGIKKVYFSKGNLQYRATSDGIPYNATTNPNGLKHKVAGGGYAQGEFRFAEHQYDAIRVGSAATIPNKGNVPEGKNLSSGSSTNTYWIDMFAYGSSGYSQYLPPYATAISQESYLNDIDISTNKNYDWGIYNAISNGGNEPELWRCLTKAEWEYLLSSKSGRMKNNGKTPFQRVFIEIFPSTDCLWKDNNSYCQPIYELGLVIYPDDYNGPTLNVTTPNTIDQWKVVEQQGAVFIPAAGTRVTSTYSTTNQYYTIGNLFYWTSMAYSGGKDAYYLYTDRTYTASGNIYNTTQHVVKTNNYAVRLVADKQ